MFSRISLFPAISPLKCQTPQLLTSIAQPVFACGGLGLYFHGQEGLAAIFSLFAAILEKFKFLVLGPLVGPLCIVLSFFIFGPFFFGFWPNGAGK